MDTIQWVRSCPLCHSCPLQKGFNRKWTSSQVGQGKRKVNFMPIATALPISVASPPRPSIVTTIPAAPRATEKLPACGYARVSRTWQEDSLQNQSIHLEQIIRADPELEFTTVYADDGISGREASNRPGLQQMLADCRVGKVGIVYTKSVSRLARNVTDLLNIVHELSDIGVPVVFEREGIKTDQMHSELFLSLMASFAAAESDSIKKNTKQGHRMRFKLGIHKAFQAPYGFDNIDGRLVINPFEAEIVREIYDRFLAGEGGYRIAKDLRSRGIPTKKGGRWEQSTIIGIVKNPASYGTIVNQKYYRDGGKVHTNRGELDMYVQDGQFPGIIEESTFNAVQELLAGRRVHYNTFRIEEDEENAWFRAQRTCFSSHLFCNQCGSTLHRANQYKYGPDVDPQMGKGWIWKCSEHAKDNSLCSMLPIKEADITRAFLNMVNKLVYSMSTDLPLLDLFIEALLGEEEDRNAEVLAHLSDELQKIDYERQSAVDLANRYAISPAAFREKMNALQRREGEIRVAQTKLEWSHAVQETEKVKSLLSSPFQATALQGSGTQQHGEVMREFDEVLFAGIVERVVVQSRQFVTFELKCGLKFTEYFAELEPGSSLGGPMLSNAAATSTRSAASKQKPDKAGDETAPFRPPYGYKRVDRRIEVVPEEAEKLRVFFKLLSEGKPIDAAGLAAGIPRKGSSLYKIAHRKAYAGTSIYPPIIDASLVRIKNNEDRRTAFVPLYSTFEFGIIPEIDQNLRPAECIGVLFREIRPVAVFQPGLADFPTRRSASQPDAVADSMSAATPPIVPMSAIKPVSAATVAPTPADTHIADAHSAVDHKNDPARTDTDDDAQPVAADIPLPIAKTNRKMRVVDLAIEMHNRRLGASPAAQDGEVTNPSVAPESVPVKEKIQVTFSSRTVTKKNETPPSPPPTPRRPITVTVSAR